MDLGICRSYLLNPDVIGLYDMNMIHPYPDGSLAMM